MLLQLYLKVLTLNITFIKFAVILYNRKINELIEHLFEKN